MQEHLTWRYATKQFDPSKKVSGEEFSALLEVLRFSPSSYGLQPWKFVVVRDKDTRAKLRPHAWNQPQITDASHLIVLCALSNMDEAYVKSYVRKMAEDRGVTPESLADYEKMMLGSLEGKTPAEVFCWMERQVYLALGMLLSQCAHQRIDACPMEGFDTEKFSEDLGLKDKGIVPVVLCAVGYRAADDKYAELPKTRFEGEDVFIHI